MKKSVCRYFKEEKGRVFFTLLSILFVCFIFSNSFYTGEASGGQSKAVLQFVQNLFSGIGVKAQVSEFFVRKLGHFTEYFLLGGLLTLTVRMYTPRPGQYLFTELFLLCLIPVLDEFLQFFVPGRGSSVADVVLDFSAAVTGMAAVFLCLWLFGRRRGKQRKAVLGNSNSNGE